MVIKEGQGGGERETLRFRIPGRRREGRPVEGPVSFTGGGGLGQGSSPLRTFGDFRPLDSLPR